MRIYRRQLLSKEWSCCWVQVTEATAQLQEMLLALEGFTARKGLHAQPQLLNPELTVPGSPRAPPLLESPVAEQETAENGQLPLPGIPSPTPTQWAPEQRVVKRALSLTLVEGAKTALSTHK